MKILIIGSGAREHAMAIALQRSTKQLQLYCCGTTLNPGIKQTTFHYWVGDITHVETIVELAVKWQIDLAIVGPEAPLEKGIADLLWAANIPTIGPRKNLARIETSKAFARELLVENKIPGTPKFKIFDSLNGVKEYLHELGKDGYVIKANGLMSGKGVKVAGDHLHSFEEAISFCQELISAQQSFIIEEKLIGQEFSFMCFCDGEHIVPMPIVQDHKRAFENDRGPNTGGMGSYSDANHSLPFLSENDVKEACEINKAVLQALTKKVREKYIGILYGGFIATKRGVYVIEFNARFGDPEALNVLTILESDFVDICSSMAEGNLSADKVKFARLATVCKYAVPKGYPDKTVENAEINISAVKNKSQLYLASVHAKDGKIYLTGSRAAAYVGVAESIPAAEEISEKEVRGIVGPLYHRTDIGTERLIQQRVDEMRRLRQSEESV